MDTLTKFKTAQYYYELDKTVLTVMSVIISISSTEELEVFMSKYRIPQ